MTLVDFNEVVEWLEGKAFENHLNSGDSCCEELVAEFKEWFPLSPTQHAIKQLQIDAKYKNWYWRYRREKKKG